MIIVFARSNHKQIAVPFVCICCFVRPGPGIQDEVVVALYLRKLYGFAIEIGSRSQNDGNNRETRREEGSDAAAIEIIDP